MDTDYLRGQASLYVQLTSWPKTALTWRIFVTFHSWGFVLKFITTLRDQKRSDDSQENLRTFMELVVAVGIHSNPCDVQNES